GRLDESLTIVRALLAGETVDFSGRVFDIERATIRPLPPARVPILVGGRSDAALHRAARHADGWLGLFVAPERYRDSVVTVETIAAANGRTDVAWNHGMHCWCGVSAPDLLAQTMESLYQVPFARFARYAPWGP